MYVVGDKLRISAQFKRDRILTDPTAITFKYRAPSDQTTRVFVFGTNAELVKESVGRYYFDLAFSEGGVWKIRYESTGAVTSADQKKYRVQAASI